MESRIPLPTDNIFKFYALFGLLLLVFGIGATLYSNQSANDFIFQVGVEYETLNADPVRTPQQEARLQLIKGKLELNKDNKRFFQNALGLITGTGIFMMIYGFKKWHTEIQPIQDEISRLNLKKLQQEVDDNN